MQLVSRLQDLANPKGYIVVYPTDIRCKEGDEVREGDTIADNKLERDRLTKQRTSLELHIKNLKDQPIRQPFEPKKSVPSQPIRFA